MQEDASHREGEPLAIEFSSLEDFKIMKRIGEGAYSSVWRVKRM